jgi:SAM-dependent methyltransferase
MSVIKDAVTPGGVIIEVGGSTGSYREPILKLGYRFVTTDYDSPAADLLADAHTLPFKTASADAVLMQGVSQAFENPFIAFGECARVLRGGGLVLGTADCCAVFASSFYNITPWGLLSVLQASGLAPERLWVTKDALEFCGTNPGYPAIVKPLLRVLSRLSRFPVLTPRNLINRRRADPLITAGSLAFVARRFL